MNYQIMQQNVGREFIPALNDDKKPLIYQCPKEAARVAAELTKIKGVKFQPRPIAEPKNNWRTREQGRFTNGEYKPVCWVGQHWWDANVNPDHFVHVSIKDPTRIAFTRSAIDGSKDLQTAMKPGKYLTEFFSKVLNTEEIRKYAMEHSTMFENKELKFAVTPEEIQKVYEPRLGSSCFSGTTKANLYGSGDFAVAYITNDKGDVTARSVCCPERKIYSFPYGDTYRLEKLLREAGFNSASYDGYEWRGLRLVKKWHWAGFYSDFGGTPVLKEDGEFLIIQ